MGSNYVRKLYIEQKGFISSDYSADEIYTLTTDKQRTIDSATAQLDGLFNRQMTFPDLDPLFNLTVLPSTGNFVTHVVNKFCPRLKQIKDSVY